jgi:hypothetical protein
MLPRSSALSIKRANALPAAILHVRQCERDAGSGIADDCGRFALF